MSANYPQVAPSFPISESPYVPYPVYNFENKTLEIGRTQWPNLDDQHYLRGCKWSPDGTCLLTIVRGGGMNVMELPADLYVGDTVLSNRPVHPLNPAVMVPESGLIYDYCWYPGMNSSNPPTCCWAASGHQGPIHLWDAFSGEKRCSYRGYNKVEELEAAMSVAFSADGQQIFGGYKKAVRIFHTSRPGQDFTEYPLNVVASCLTSSLAQPGVVAIGSWKNSIELVSQSDGTFRHLCKLSGHKGGITHMAFSLDGIRLYSGARKDNELICWDLRVPGRPLFCLQRHSNTNQRIYLDLSRDGQWLVSGGTDGKVQVWNVSQATTPTVHMELPLHSDCCNGVSLHPFRPILATSSGQHHVFDPLMGNKACTTYENALNIWWVGHQQEVDMESIVQQIVQ